MARRDVELVIKARNQAGKSLEAVSQALESIRKNQARMETGAKGFDKLADEAERAGKALALQNTQTSETLAKLNALQAQLQAASSASAKFDAQVKAGALSKEKYEAASKAVAAAEKDLARQVQVTANQLTRQSAALEEAQRDFQRLSIQMNAVEKDMAASQARKAFEQWGASLKGAAGSAQTLAAQARVTGAGWYDALSRMNFAAVQVTNSLQKATGASAQPRAAISFWRAFTNELMRVPIAAQTAERQIRAANAAAKSGVDLQRTALSISQRYNAQFLAIVSNLTGVYAAINQVQQTVQTIQDVDAAASRLSVVFGEKVAPEMTFLSSEARRLGFDMGTLGKEWGRFTVAASLAGLEMEEARRIFVSVAEAGVVNRLSADDLAGAFRALTQMMSKGKVTAEELRGQFGERIPGAVGIFARALGVSTAQLEKMLEQGEVIANGDVFSAVARELDSLFGGGLSTALDSTTASLGRLRVAIVEAQLNFARGGFEKALRRISDSFAAFISSDEGQKFFQGLGAAIGGVIEFLSSLIENFEQTGLILQVIIGIGIAKWFLTLAQSANTAAMSVVGLSAEARAARTQLARVIDGQVIFAWRGLTVASRALRTEVAMLRGGMAGTGAASVAAAGGMVVLRGAVVGLTVAMRSLYSLLGGIPGILLAIVSIGLTEWFASWVSEVPGANDVLDKHKQIVDKVGEAYRKAQGDGQKFREELEKVLTGSELRAVADQLSGEEASGLERIAAALRDIESAAGSGRGGSRLGTTRKELIDLVQSFKDGKIDAEQFGKELDRVTKGSSINPALVGQMAAIAREVEKARDALAENAQQQKILEGDTKALEAASKDLAGSLDQVADSLDTRPLERYGEAIDNLRKMIPGLANEVDRLSRIGQALGQFQIAMNEAFSMRDPSRMLTAMSTYGQAIGAINLEAGQENFAMARQRGPRARPTATDTASLLRFGTEAAKPEAGDLVILKGGGFATVRGVGTDGRLNTDRGAFSGSDPNVLSVRRAPLESEVVTSGLLATEKAASSAAEKVGELRSEYAEWVRTIEEENAIQAAKNAGDDARVRSLTIEAQVRQQVAKWQRDGNVLSQQELDNIRALTTQQYDLANAMSQREQMQRKIDDLDERRSLLMEQIDFARENGQTETAAALKVQLQGVNAELMTAIERMIAFWAATGGPEAENAILKLQNLRNTLKTTADRTIDLAGGVKLSVREINEMASQGLAQAFDRFAQRVAEGENALTALRDAFLEFASEFLRQIAQMIIQQMIFNLLQGLTNPTGAPMPGGGGGVPTGHTGGLVKASQIGNNPVRQMQIPRFHEGGFPGLRAGEVAAILQVGEEVITANDPRHAANGGGSRGGVTIVNAIDVEDAAQKILGSPTGEGLVLNVIRTNARAVRQALG